MKKTLLLFAFALMATTLWAQKHLPEVTYDARPATLRCRVIHSEDTTTYALHLRCMRRYCSGLPWDGLWETEWTAWGNADFTMTIPVHMTHRCDITFGPYRFPCYVVPGATVAFTIDARRAREAGLPEGITFSGPLASLNRDLVRAWESGTDPEHLWLDIERKRNEGTLINLLPTADEQGYFDFLEQTYRRIEADIAADRRMGAAYREYARGVNLYEWGNHMHWCGQAIQWQGITDSEADYDAYVSRMRERIGQYMQSHPWDHPAAAYVMWGFDNLPKDHFDLDVDVPAGYRKCYEASNLLKQMGQDKQPLSETQKSDIQRDLPELAEDLLAYDESLTQQLASIAEDSLSHVRQLPPVGDGGDVLSALLRPYRGRPVLLELWETTCGPCRLAFREMHDTKLRFRDRMHFVSVASTCSDHATWQRLVASYVGDHYRLTEPELLSLHRQVPCRTNSIPVWLLINPDGTIHHAFTGYRNLDDMMKEISPVLE